MKVTKYGTIELTNVDGLDFKDWVIDCEGEDCHYIKLFQFMADKYIEEITKRLQHNAQLYHDNIQYIYENSK